MKSRRIIFGILLIILCYLGFSYLTGAVKLPGFSLYKTYPNVIGGCFNICDGNKKLINCRGNPDDLTDSFASCTYYCVGKLNNTCY